LFLLDNKLSGCNCSQMLWFAVASLMSLPVPTNVREPDVRAIFSVDDFPAYLVQEGISRTVYVRATVSPDGTLQSCGAEVSSGDSKLDAYTCQIVVRRAKFSPAKWPDGTTVYGVLRVPINWVISDSPLPDEALLKAIAPDLELSVNKLPQGAHKVVGVELEVAADESGRITACEEEPTFRGDPRKHFPELVPIACEQAATLRLSPPTNASGKPMRSVQTVSVHFEAAN
jgi:TonB family protein